MKRSKNSRSRSATPTAATIPDYGLIGRALAFSSETYSDRGVIADAQDDHNRDTNAGMLDRKLSML